MADDPVTLEFIGRQLSGIEAELRQVRADHGMMMTLVAAQSDWHRQFEQCLVPLDQRLVQFDQRLVQFDQRLLGQTDSLFGEFKCRIDTSQSMVERRMDDLVERVEELETGKSRSSP